MLYVTKLNMEEISLITGASGCIGSSTSKYFAKKGMVVLITDINDESGQKLEREIISSGGKAKYYHMDVCSKKEVRDVLGDIGEEYGRINHTICIAGGALGENNLPFEEIPEEIKRKTFELNYFGVCSVIENAVHLMEGLENASIVVTGSGNADQAIGNPYYSSSKGALKSLVKYLSSQYGQRGIRVNMIVPGTVQSERTKKMYKNSDVFKELKEKITYGNDFIPPEDIADGIYFLTQNKSANGCKLILDRGQSAGKHIV